MHTYAGSVLFCSNGALCCCLANKVPGLRAAMVAGAMQASRIASTASCAGCPPGVSLRNSCRSVTEAPPTSTGSVTTVSESSSRATPSGWR